MKKLFYSLLLVLGIIIISLPIASVGKGLVFKNKDSHRQKDTARKIKVLFYLQDSVEMLDFAGPMEVFAIAGFDVATVSKTKSPILAHGILKITPDYSIDDAPQADILAFFGGRRANVVSDTVVIQWIKNKTSPKYYFSVCTGAFILGKAGLLDHLTVTTWHGKIEKLQNTVPTAKVIANVRFVDNGRVITSAGVSSGIDGALHLVAKILGEETALKIAKYMEYNWIPAQGLVISSKSAAP